LPAKYGGEVTTSATDPSATSLMSRESPRYSSSRALGSLTTSSVEATGSSKRA
jgi:hypothetical protein